jgi:hypothetical protein
MLETAIKMIRRPFEAWLTQQPVLQWLLGKW